MKIQLPAHSDPCHVVTVYDGTKCICEHLIDRKILGNEFDVSEYANLVEPRFEHSPASQRGDKQPHEYRAIARIDGVWHPYDPDKDDWGLPAIPKVRITDLHPAHEKEAAAQDATQPEAKKDESLAPATDKEKKSRTRQ